MNNSKQKIRIGMVGGGQGAFIGNVHRIAMRISDRYSLEAACFSSDPLRAAASAEEIGIPANRSYSDFQSMAQAEAAIENGITAVVIVTPNHLHFPIAKCFLEHGIHVICDKPLTMTSAETSELITISERVGKHVFVTYNYTGYPMIREARERVRCGDLGEIRIVQVEYSQDWLATALEQSGQKQASWRTDPKQAGAAGCLGDIGVHAFNLAHFVSGITPTKIAADLHSFVRGRVLDDHAQVFMRYANGARGSLLSSQVAVGKENHLRLQIFGDKGSLDWCQEQPNQLSFSTLDGAMQILSRARHQISQASRDISLIPAGHPEGYLEAFAVLYTEFANILAEPVKPHVGANSNAEHIAIPAYLDLCFIEACIASSAQDSTWVSLKT
ncbi:Gfo/Idh/MocA family oxidoreductase [Undibacterium amnicola]|uniref:Gfo/Idh/MocA family oxidoreductase n=1 Tax=Undibacterium amnicola TaxID=1834038 RepID=A0ABR6XRH0_9BURK|nr:Gfo/Idh/MocA family oxidoreductase [Undibacterium amnicola]MBC3832085.1 Gfo/Idh/MocA family oxidoreductase [Undibacterium amnicola]